MSIFLVESKVYKDLQTHNLKTLGVSYMYHSSRKEAMIVIMHRMLTRGDVHVCCHEGNM